jgi:formylglycine-generating enzyme required for sulfatase activity
MRWWFVGVTLVATAALAGPKKAVEGAPASGFDVLDIPGLRETLLDQGWTPTVEQSSMMKVGDVRKPDGTPAAYAEKCFPNASPRSGVKVSAEIVQTLSAGGRVRLGLVSATADGYQYQIKTFADPLVEEMDDLDLAGLSKDCRDYFATQVIAGWVVVKSTLAAMVTEKLCREADASVSAVVVGQVQATLDQECSASSNGHVTVALKTVPVTALMGLPTARTEIVVPAGPASEFVFRASFDTSLSVDEALKEQNCAAEASSAAAATRAKNVAAAVAGEQAKATAAWGTLGPAAEKCTAVVDSATRKGCADKVAAFVAQAEALTIEVTAGFETVATACGSRQVPLAAERPSVPVAEVASARAMMVRLQQPGAAPPGQSYDVRGYTMVALAPGSFDMGCTPGQGSVCDDDEKVVHRVELTAPLWIGETEVTQGLYRAVTGKSPSGFSTCGDDCPVEQVTWCDAVAFANALSVAERLRPAYTVPSGFVVGMSEDACNAASPKVAWDRMADGYRLPTEAEWEYAARAGQDLPYSGGAEVGAVAWYGPYTWNGSEVVTGTGGNSGEKTHQVATRRANAWGLHDMSGNVWEWTADWYASTYTAGTAKNPPGPGAGDQRVYRGGGFALDAAWVRVALRFGDTPGYSVLFLGFRLARGVPGPVSAP